jgi:hypothetical protein
MKNTECKMQNAKCKIQVVVIELFVPINLDASVDSTTDKPGNGGLGGLGEGDFSFFNIRQG